MKMNSRLLCVLLSVGVICVNGNILKNEGAKRSSESQNFLRARASSQPRGGVWPLPQSQKSNAAFLVVRPSEFQFVTTGETCDILDTAFNRYFGIIFEPPRLFRNKAANYKSWKKNPYFAGYLSELEVALKNPCERWPSSNMDEKYNLEVNTNDSPGKAVLNADSIWGILRGLETFSQLIYQNDDGAFQLNSTQIIDYPRFSFRGLMVDTGRHYLPKRKILENLEAMAQNKFNVFHWHITDDQSFPFQSSSFPSLSKEGAYDPYTHIYTLEDIAEIIEFARLRGIRVIPELDSPGHTESWGLGITDLLTQCYVNKSGVLVPNGYGPINPILDSTYKTLKTLFSEIVHVFPEKYVHLGGDEVSFSCWQSNPDVLAFMKKMGFGSNFAKLEEYYMQKLLAIISSFPSKNSYIIWQEVLDNGAVLKSDTVVEVWKSGYQNELAFVTSKGYRTLLSACWYLDNTHIGYFSDWATLYSCEPYNFNGTDAQKKLVFGGEACMWGESVDGTNLISRVWPRASTVAERLWSAQSVNSTAAAAPRLQQHRCLMLSRGFNAEPQVGPGFCPNDYKVV